MTLDALQHPRFARVYARLAATMDRRGAAAHRSRLVTGLSGRVLEVGAGHGGNFAHYPAAVTEVVAVEPDDQLRRLAGTAALTAPIPVRVVAGHADALPAADGSMDAAVTSLVLCSVPDPATALAEIRRVLVPGGQLRFYEHVRSRHRLLATAEDAVAPAWSRVAGGCHPNRDTAAAITAAGFTVQRLDRFGFRVASLVPPVDHILGTARLVDTDTGP
jgi:ubiquinone/menaquinone biosynthesis C-methylase UbiE